MSAVGTPRRRPEEGAYGAIMECERGFDPLRSIAGEPDPAEAVPERPLPPGNALESGARPRPFRPRPRFPMIEDGESALRG